MSFNHFMYLYVDWIYASLCLFLIGRLILIDIKTFQLPNSLTYSLITSGILYNVISPRAFSSPEASLIGAILGFAIIWASNFIYRHFRKQDGIGLGDAKLLAGLGAILGHNAVIPILLIACLLGMIGGYVWLKLRHETLNNYFPFGPFIGIAGIAGILDEVLKLHILLSFGSFFH